MKQIMDFGTLLKSLRERDALGIKRLAPKLAVSYTYLSKLENNHVMPSEQVIDRISKYFNYSKDELLLAADKIPEDVRRILRENPREAVEYLRSGFASIRPPIHERRPLKNTRK